MTTVHEKLDAATKPKYIGLWTKEDKNGNPFLSGSDDDLVYFIFRDQNDATKKTLSTLPKGTARGESKFKRVGTFDTLTGDKGEYQRLGNMCIYPNEFRTEEKHPHFNLVIYPDEV